MYHSITFGSKNTWDNWGSVLTSKPAGSRNTWEDWHLMPSSRPVFNPPKPKLTTIDIPGGDGFIDLSESLTKYPLYNNREGSIEFIVSNGFKPWNILYSEIANYLHGKVLRAILEDDPQYYYEGRFSINKWDSKNDGTWSVITIDYNVKPYKIFNELSNEPWLWDPFNFETGAIREKISDITVSSNTTTWFDLTGLIGRMPIIPTFIVNPASDRTITMTVINKELDINSLEKTFNESKKYKFGDVVLSEINDGNEIKLGFKGYGTVSLEYRRGDL